MGLVPAEGAHHEVSVISRGWPSLGERERGGLTQLDEQGIVEQDNALRQVAEQAFYKTSRSTLRDLRPRASCQQPEAVDAVEEELGAEDAVGEEELEAALEEAEA